jgi:hypothetical protein
MLVRQVPVSFSAISEGKLVSLATEVDMKERETNYNPVLENIRFMIGQLNTELKARHLR